MNDAFFQDQLFEQKDFTDQHLPEGEYEACTFQQCIFSGLLLGKYQFSDCRFEACDLSMVHFHQTSLQEIEFLDCKMIGCHLEDVNSVLLSFSMKNCLLDFAFFEGLRLPETTFENCKMEGTNFAQAKLQGAVFKNCLLDHAIFENTDLQNCDFRTARNVEIDPEKNQIKGAAFSLHSLPGLLRKYELKIDY